MKSILFSALFFITSSAMCQKYTQAQIDSMVKMVEAGAGEEIAPAFNGTTSTLFIFKNQKNMVNEKLEKNVEEHYKGNYKFLETGEALSPKDTANARFFVMIFDRMQYASGTGVTRTSNEIEYSMTMTDRKTQKIYRYGLSTSCINCLFKQYF